MVSARFSQGFLSSLTARRNHSRYIYIHVYLTEQKQIKVAGNMNVAYMDSFLIWEIIAYSS